jgi:spermidine/putrescine ABC transporter ATP-binding subunit
VKPRQEISGAHDASAVYNPLLNIRGVKKSFGGVAAVRGVELHVDRGEFLTLLGPSGCGKTTLMRMVAGFEMADSGSIQIEGRDITRVPPYQRKVGMMFQNLALFPHMSVGQNVAYGLQIRGVSASETQRQVRDALKLVDLAGMEGRSVHQLSGGQRQRVALARAVVVRPSLICLDEPLSALDLKLRRQMQRELKLLQRQLGMTFLFVTHDQDEALAMSDRIAVMNHGRIEQIGTTRDVYNSPATAFVARFVGETNFMEAKLEGDSIRLPGFGLSRPAPSAANRIIKPALSIRPESIELCPPGRGLLEGTIKDQTFFGAGMRYEIAVGDKTICAVAPCRGGQLLPFGLGDRVGVGWSPEAEVVVEQVNCNADGGREDG